MVAILRRKPESQDSLFTTQERDLAQTPDIDA
jgi:hypothetical protein